jgi:signal transduction histidine kinase
LDGQLLFGTDSGYYAINPAQLKVNPQVPKIEFTDFWIGNESINSSNTNTDESFDNTKEIELSHEQNIFSVGFSINDFSSFTQKVIYTLEGYDLNWRQPGSEGRAYYFNVPPGTYAFTVKARNGSNANWQERKISIHILPPWWRTWWAYGSFGVVFIGLVFSVDRFQRSRLLKRAEAESKEKELAQAREIEKAYTELKATQSQLIQSEKMASLGELTAGIAHEIQNPLNFVNNFSEVNKELLLEMNDEISKGNFNDVKEIAKNVIDNEEKIIFHGKRADGIVKGMLQHSRASSGQKELTDINELCDEYLRLSYHGLRAKDKSFNATFKTDLDPTLGKISIVPQDIGRVVLNLLTNAFYAVNEKKKKSGSSGAYEPTVIVTTKSVGGKIVIQVRDNGNGIPESITQKIFQPFFTTKPAGQGTGLGLSMSYDIVTKGHSGNLTVESHEGGGSTFIIVLPVQ